MVDLEPFLEAPFEEASNLSFEVLLGLGVALWVAVAVLGRSRVTTAAVAVYLLLIPGYVGYRIRAWDGDEDGADSSGGDGEETSGEEDGEETSDDDVSSDDSGGGDSSDEAATEANAGGDEAETGE